MFYLKEKKSLDQARKRAHSHYVHDSTDNPTKLSKASLSPKTSVPEKPRKTMVFFFLKHCHLARPVVKQISTSGSRSNSENNTKAWSAQLENRYFGLETKN